jgi:hypothetical protein
MKPSIIVIYFLLCFINLCTAQKTWTGTGGNKLWNNANNWMPVGVPIASDNVIINISDSINVNQAVTLNALHITNNATVILAAISSRTISLTSTSTTTLGLLIETNCTLYMQGVVSGTSAISLVLDMANGLGATGEIHGSLIFRKVGAGTGTTNCRLETYTDVANYAQLVVKNGGVIKYNPNTSNTSSLGAPLNTLTFEDGSTFWINKNGGSFPAGNFFTNSLIKKTGDCTSLTGFNNSIYGNLEWDCPTQTFPEYLNENLVLNNVEIKNTGTDRFIIKTGTSVGSDTLILNNLIVHPNAIVSVTNNNVLSGNGGTIIVNGNIINNGVINSLGINTASNLFTLEGNNNQTITGIGTFGPKLDFSVNKSGGIVSLQNDITINGYALKLLNGIVNTNTYTLTIHDSTLITSSTSTSYSNLNTAGYSNYGNDYSYINGKLKIIGLNNVSKKAFPVGNTNFHRPIFLNDVSGDFTVQYFSLSPRAQFGVTYGSGLDHISDIEYWQIDGINSPQAKVELTYYDPNSGGVTVMNDLRVARYNGTNWTNEGNASYIGSPGSNGSITSNVITSFSPFSLASSTTNNPLPSYQFAAYGKIINNYAHINWNINYIDIVNFVIEKSIDGIQFYPLNNYIHNTTNHYITYDTKSIYRIKTILQSGRFVYSNIIKLNQEKLFVHRFPNPCTNMIHINVPSTNGYLKIFNAKQELLWHKKTTSTLETINVSKFSSGLYYIQYINSKNEILSNSFFKN